MSPPGANDAERARFQDRMKSADEDKFEMLNNKIGSMETDVKTLLNNQDLLVELFNAHLPVVMGSQNSHAASDSERGRVPAADTAFTDGKQGNATMEKNKKKKKKKSKGDGNNAMAANWATGNSAKIFIGLFFITLLLSVALVLGWGGVWGSSPSLLRKRNGQPPTAQTFNVDTAVDDTMHSAKQPRDGAKEESIDTSLGPKLESFDSLLTRNVKVKAAKQRITQSRSLPPTSIDHESNSYYYPSWKNGIYCDNDPSQRPKNYIEIGHTLFETAEDCCNHWTTDQGFTTNEGYNTCLLNSARTSPPQATETGILATSSTVSGSKSALITSDLSQAKDSHVPSSIPTTMDTSNFPTSTVHYQGPHHLDHPNHGDNDITHTNRPATEASNEPTHSLTSSPNDDQDDKSSVDIPKINGDDGHDDLTVDQDEHGIDDIPEIHEENNRNESADDQDDPDSDETPDGHEGGANKDVYVCAPDPEKCGCPGLKQADYRGRINTNKFGTSCERWDADWVRKQLNYTEQQYIDAGLEENYCRNPSPEDNERAWCYTAGGSGEWDYQYCSVPKCRRATPACTVADENTCGCDNVQQSDYRGTMNTTADGVPCVAWGVHRITDFLQEYPKSGLESDSNNSEGNTFCRNPVSDSSAWCLTTSDPGWDFCDVPMCNPHQCMPPCGTPNFDSSGCPSFLQAENCCEEEEDTSSCKCGYLKEACHKSIENSTQDFCDDAEAACYEGKYDPHYKCRMYEQICSEMKTEYACKLAATNCCEFDVAWWAAPQCFCDFFTYTTDVLGVEGNLALASEKCLEAAKPIPFSEVRLLTSFYRKNGGEHWFNNDGWLEDEDHCNWFGVACNGAGFVTEVNLRNNNLTGTNPFALPLELTWLDLAENNLSGAISKRIWRLRKLVHIDISKNQFSGHADMTFSPSTVHANYSHNKLTSAGFNRFNAAYETIRVVDLSSNHINQAALDLFANIPPNLEELYLSNNNIRGALPFPFPSLNNLRRLAIANNNINGRLPDFSRSTPRIRVLDLSSQERTNNGGFTGIVSADISRLDDLLVLNLAINNLTSIPSDLGNLLKLKILNVSSNFLDQTIPSELGKLGGVLDSLDLSDNTLKGLIPKDFDQFDDTNIHLRGNPDILHPAPLMLCFREFDLGNDTEMCPPERNALKFFYESANGQDWTNNTMWMDPYESFCKWHGVTCSEKNCTVEVNLTNNALSGTLSKHISELTHLTILDLSDNDLMGSIPKAIGRLSKLVRLRLPYNRFGGEMPSELKNLSELELAQFHANRISGTMPLLDWDNQEQSSYITDCGNPSDFETSLVCSECSMCCNSQGDCYPQEKTMVEEAGFKNYVFFSLAFLAILIGVSGVLALAVFAYDKHQNRHVPRETIRSPELISGDEKYAVSTIGEDSTYQFFQGKSWFGWMISLATVGVQIWLLFIFVTAADIDLADETSALVYTWKCPRDRVECEFKGDLTLQGWVLFFILMVAYLMKDFVNGYRLVVLSAKERHVRDARVRYFVGGTVLTAVTLFTLGVSGIYNYATATSNPELVANSVIILFIADLDEQFYGILMAINPGWVKEMSCEVGGSDEEESQTIRDLRREMKELRESLRLLAQQVRGGNATQPQAIGSSSRHSNVSNRSSSSSGGGSDWSGSPPRFRNTRRPSPTTRPRRNAFSIPSEPRIHHPSSIGRDGSFRPTSTSASDTTARSPTIRPSMPSAAPCAH